MHNQDNVLSSITSLIELSTLSLFCFWSQIVAKGGAAPRHTLQPCVICDRDLSLMCFDKRGDVVTLLKKPPHPFALLARITTTHLNCLTKETSQKLTHRRDSMRHSTSPISKLNYFVVIFATKGYHQILFFDLSIFVTNFYGSFVV